MSDIDNSGSVAYAHGDAGLIRRWFPTLFEIGPISRRALKNGRVWLSRACQLCTRIWRRIRPTVVVLLVVGAVLHISFNIYATVLLNRALAVIRGRGEPYSLSDLNAGPKIADEENAAVYYHKAYQLLKEPAKTPWGFKWLISGYPQHQTKREVARCKMAIALVRQATQLASCQFPNGLESWPRTREVGALARLMNESAVWEAKHGDPANCMTDVDAIFTMSRRLANEPLETAFMGSQVVDTTAYHTLAQVLESTPGIAPNARAFLSRLPAQNGGSAPIVQALIVERREGIDSFETVRANPAAWPLYHKSREDQHSILSDYSYYNNEAPIRRILLAPLRILLVPITRKNDIGGELSSESINFWYIKEGIHTQSPLVQLLYKSWTFVNAPLGALWSPFWKMDEVAYISAMDTTELRTARAGSEGNKLPKAAWSVGLSEEGLSRLRLVVDRSVVSRKLADVALALAWYRASQGHYPANLDEAAKIAGPLPLDPDTGKAFVYHLKAPSYLLYGVGLNHRDDGGNRQCWVWPILQDDVYWGNQASSWSPY